MMQLIILVPLPSAAMVRAGAMSSIVCHNIGPIGALPPQYRQAGEASRRVHAAAQPIAAPERKVPLQLARKEKCEHIGKVVRQNPTCSTGMRWVYRCGKGHGEVSPSAGCQTCGDYEAE